MIDQLKRFRELATWVVLAVLLAGMGLAVGQIVYGLLVEGLTVTRAFEAVSGKVMNLVVPILLIGLVLSCLFVAPATPRAQRLTKISAWLVTIGTALGLVFMVVGVAASATPFAMVVEILGGLLDAVLKAVTAIVLWLLVRGLRAGRVTPATAEPAEAPAELTESRPAPAEAQSVLAPVWQPEQAAGASWRTASDAASGASASSWGESGRPAAGNRWQPSAPRSADSAPEPAAQPTDSAAPAPRQWRPVEQPKP